MTLNELRRILLRCQYKDWTMRVESPSGFELRFSFAFTARDYRAPSYPHREWSTRWHDVRTSMTESEVVQTVFAACIQAEEHGCREAFHYGNDRPFQPHINFGALLAASRNYERDA